MKTSALQALKPLPLILVCAGALALAACGGGSGSSKPAVSAANSTIAVAPSSVPADGSATAAITVILRDAKGNPWSGNADVAISADPCSACKLSYESDSSSGTVTGTLSSSAVEDIVLGFTVNGESSPSMATVHFTSPAPPPPNIVLILLDDMGIDQWRLFGYGGLAPASMPNIADIAKAGVKFHNLWSMPACSNGRATLFTGRYPLRTHVMTAIGNNDLANYMVNPNEMTLPDLLHLAGYKSALFGKFHMGIQANDPYGLGMIHAIGFDYYEGWTDETGDPSSIDTTAGGVSPPGTWSCGFVRDAAHGGADSGACYAADGSCQEMSKTGAEAPGRICRDGGGIFDPNKTCQDKVPDYINFDNYSGYYVSPLTINKADGSVIEVPPTDIRARTYRSTEPVDAALDWIAKQPAGEPWMVTLSFAADHTPIMQPPIGLLPKSEPDTSNFDCGNVVDQQFLSNQMEEAMDHEVGRFLVSAGLATRNDKGQLIYDPAKTNTYVIVVSDNGSLGTVVKVPFDKQRAKSTAYQTGVWNPGIVAGPGVVDPGRTVYSMVNIVDIYQLVGKLAGIDAHQVVPRTLDSQAMLPYLTNPDQAEIRKSNYTEVGYNKHANGALNGPCVFTITTPSCSQITPSAGVCHDNGGTWWGPNPDNPDAPSEGFGLCCEVSIWQHDHGETPVTDMFPKLAYAVRNDNYKLIVNHYDAYDAATNACVDTTSTEFYQINEDVPTPKLDKAGDDLLASGEPLTPKQQQNYDELSQKLQDIRDSQPYCPADINLDGVVDQKDIAQWKKFKKLSQGKSSWADVNQDGLTNGADKTQIEDSMGACPTASTSAAATPIR